MKLDVSLSAFRGTVGKMASIRISPGKQIIRMGFGNCVTHQSNGNENPTGNGI